MSKGFLTALMIGSFLEAVSSNAAAQSSELSQTTTAQSSEPSENAAAQAGEPSESHIDQIVVSAQKRPERIQDVPISVTVVSGDQTVKQNILTDSDLTKAVPALSISNFADYSVRGIGTQGFAISAEHSVSFVVNGVVRQDANAAAGPLYDVDHVEVLSGPQGLLFGKNSTGGVVSITTKAPRLGVYEAAGHFDYGNFDVVNANVMGNIPIGNDAAARVAVFNKQQGGLFHNNFYNRDDYTHALGGRLNLLWRPEESLRINLLADYDREQSNGMGDRFDVLGVSTFLTVDQTSMTPGAINGRKSLTQCPTPIVPGPNNTSTCANTAISPFINNSEDVYAIHHEGASLQFDYDLLPSLTLTSISALRDAAEGNFSIHADVNGYFGDGFAYNYLDRNLTPHRSTTFSEELRLASSKSDRLNYVAGLYYSRFETHVHGDQAGQFGIPVLDQFNLEYARVFENWLTTKDYALFGQANFKVTDQFEVYAGGRYTYNDISDLGLSSFPSALVLSNASPPNGVFNPATHSLTQLYTGYKGFFSIYPINTCTFAGGDPDKPATCPAGTSMSDPATIHEGGVTWKLGANYHVDRDVMLYASATRGYKGPFIPDQASFTVPVNANVLTVRPEYPMALEIGVKSKIFHRLALDASLFHDRISGYQTTLYVPSIPNVTAVPQFLLGNAPYAVTQGAEISFFGEITDDFSVNGGAMYDDAHFSPNFQVACSSFEVGCGAKGTVSAINQMPYAPKVKANMTAEYGHHIFGTVDGFANVDVAYTGTYPYSSDPLQPVSSAARTIFGSRVGLRSANEQWGVSLWCRNCLDHRYPLQITAGDPANGPATRLQFLTLDSFRTFGISLDAKF